MIALQISKKTFSPVLVLREPQVLVLTSSQIKIQEHKIYTNCKIKINNKDKI